MANTELKDLTGDHKNNLDGPVKRSSMIKIKAVFSSYYKYSFIYEAQYKEKPLIIYIGGSSADIYRLELSAEQSFDIPEEQIEFNEKNDNYTYEQQDEY